MSVSLFRRWRSQKFSDLVGQEAVVSTLQNVLRGGDPARAYLFCGPRGTGKTSSARIFAKALNCENGPAAEPCNECSQCLSIADGSNLDVFEIDAASHTQVDKIRDFIVEKVHFSPVSARYKVYIIDEVHKLSTSSFNALLKTLEEPPPHVVFVLATTHPHEMPATILSRCQRYDFRPLTATETEKHLHMIAGVESIDLDEDAARHLARAADGSLRDALVLFEQAHVFSEGRVTRDKVLDLLGGVGYEVLEQMFTDLESGNASAALERLDQWIVRGRDLKRLAESFQDHLRMLLLLKVKSEDQSIRHLSAEERESLERLTGLLSVGAITQWLRKVGEMLGQIRHGRRARLEWEMLLVTLAHPESEPTVEGLERRVDRLESGRPVAASGEGAAAAIPSDLLQRITRLEKAPSPASASVPPDLLDRLAKLEQAKPSDEILARLNQLENRSEDDRIRALEAQIAKLSAGPPPTPEPVAPSPRVAQPLNQRETEQMPPDRSTQPLKSPPAPPAAESLPSDVVDEWLEMPQVLVTGRIERSGQTSLLDSFEDEPEPLASDSEEYGAPYAPHNYEQPYDSNEESPDWEPAQPSKIKVNGSSSKPEPVAEVPEPEFEPEPTPKQPEPVAEAPAPEPIVEQEPEPEPEPEYEPPPEPEYEPPPEPDYEPPPEEPTPAPEPVAAEPEPEAPPAAPVPDSKEFFRLLMQKVKEQDIRLHAVLADARLTHLAHESFELAVPAGYEWHFGKIQEGRKLLESVAQVLMPGSAPRLECSIGGEKAAPPKENEHEELVKRASGVFGGSSIVD